VKVFAALPSGQTSVVASVAGLAGISPAMALYLSSATWHLERFNKSNPGKESAGLFEVNAVVTQFKAGTALRR
jgi:hypothetical protein